MIQSDQIPHLYFPKKSVKYGIVLRPEKVACFWFRRRDAAYSLYRRSTTVEEQRKWICVAACLGLPAAQAEMARMYWRPPPPTNTVSPFSRDIVKAYVWGCIATRNGEHMQDMTQLLTLGMSEEKLLEAKRLVKEWKPRPGECN